VKPIAVLEGFVKKQLSERLSKISKLREKVATDDLTIKQQLWRRFELACRNRQASGGFEKKRECER